MHKPVMNFTVGAGRSKEPCTDMQVRLLTQSRHELLRRVPDGLADVFRIGSTAPGL